ncbi:MAG: EamA family transporter [Anaerolineae bacterium]|nr:EamA family transporter [Anaerolineae bacterium]
MHLTNFFRLFFLALLWGSSFLFVKVAVAEIPPFTTVLMVVGIATLVLYGILRWQGGRLPKFGPIWTRFAVAGLLHNALPFALLVFGEQHVDSALAAVLNGTSPLYAILLAHFLTKDDRLTSGKSLGLFVGFGGLLFFVLPSLRGGVHASLWGLIAVGAAAASYGIAIVYTRTYLRDLPPLVAPTAQLGMATVYALPLALLIDKPFSLTLPSVNAIGAVLALALFGTALSYIVYYRLIKQMSASHVSMVTYLVPIVGLVLGVVVLNEQLTWNAYVGCALILAGVMLVNGFIKLPHRLSRPSDEVFQT